MRKQKTEKLFLSFLGLLLVLVAFSLIFLSFCGNVHCPQNEAIDCIYVQQRSYLDPRSSTFLSLSIKESVPTVRIPVSVPSVPPTNRTTYQPPSTFLSLSIKEAEPTVPITVSVPSVPLINQITYQSSSKLSRKHQKSLRILRPSAHSKLFAQRTTEFINAHNSNSTSCNLTFFMTWIAPLKYFGARELFAIESLFKWHRDACLLIISTTMDSSKGAGLLRPFMESGFRVAALSPDYEYLVSGTPAEAWFNRLIKGEVVPGEVSIRQNLSNLLRLLVLYKYGGIYLDTDVIVVKSFFGLRNCIGAQTRDAITHHWSRLNNAVMVFDKKHTLLLEFISEFASTFDGNKWGYNGPYLVSRVVSRVAGKRNCDVNVLPPIAFYPLDWSQIGSLFQGPTDKAHSRWIRQKLYWIKKASFAVHLWNRQSRGIRMEKGSIVEKILLDSCLFCNSSVAAILH